MTSAEMSHMEQQERCTCQDAKRRSYRFLQKFLFTIILGSVPCCQSFAIDFGESANTVDNSISSVKKSDTNMGRWVNPCDGSITVDIDLPWTPPRLSEQELRTQLAEKIRDSLRKIVVAKLEVEALLELYGNDRFGHMKPPYFQGERLDGMLDNLYELQKKYNTLPSLPNELGSSSVMHAAYEDLSRASVFLELALQYETSRHSVFDGHSFKQDLSELLHTHIIDNILCQLRQTVGLLGHEIDIEVRRDIADVYQNVEGEAFIHMRDYLVLQDFHVLLELLETVFNDIVTKIENEGLTLQNYL